MKIPYWFKLILIINALKRLKCPFFIIGFFPLLVHILFFLLIVKYKKLIDILADFLPRLWKRFRLYFKDLSVIVHLALLVQLCIEQNLVLL